MLARDVSFYRQLVQGHQLRQQNPLLGINLKQNQMDLELHPEQGYAHRIVGQAMDPHIDRGLVLPIGPPTFVPI
jgi:hypothetical protein